MKKKEKDLAIRREKYSSFLIIKLFSIVNNLFTPIIFKNLYMKPSPMMKNCEKS